MNGLPGLAGGQRKWRKKWCERRGLNSQGLLRWILNPVRMPVSPLSHGRAIYCKAMNLTQLRAGGKRKSILPAERNVILSCPKRGNTARPSHRKAAAPHGYPVESFLIRARPGMQTVAGGKGPPEGCSDGPRRRGGLCGVKFFLQPVLHGVGGHEYPFQSAELLMEVVFQFPGERKDPQIFRGF